MVWTLSKKRKKNADFSPVPHGFRHAQAASAVWASPTIEGDPRRDQRPLGMADTDKLSGKSTFFSSLSLILFFLLVHCNSSDKKNTTSRSMTTQAAADQKRNSMLQLAALSTISQATTDQSPPMPQLAALDVQTSGSTMLEATTDQPITPAPSLSSMGLPINTTSD